MNWQGVSVLVTGAGGFIGSHLTEELVRRGATVRALVEYNSLGSWGWLDDSEARRDAEILLGDIRDSDFMERAARGVDTVFHLAALIAIPYSYEAPRSYVETNVVGTVNVLSAGSRAGARRIVHTSTSEVYGTAQYVPIDEKHPLQGQSPYSASKIAADKMAEAYQRSFSLPVVTVRPFNTFGPRQSARAAIPTIVTQALVGPTVKLGALSPTRDLNYVSNIVDGMIRAASAPDVVGRTLNLGSGREISIGDLAKLIGRLMNRELSIESEAARLRPEASEVERLLADATSARDLLGWQPSISLEDGLSRTIDWLQNNLHRYRPGEYQR